VVAALVVAPALLVLLARLGLNAGDIGRSLARPLAGGAVAAGVALATAPLVSNDFVQLAVAGTLGLAAYLAVIAPLRRRPELRPA
jgi:hypothetical protein